jgi:hypothetical protein
MDAPGQFVYPVTTARSGARFLSRLLAANLPAAEVHHEFSGFPHFARRTPDISHLTTFNHVGNVPEVRSFWRRKFGEDLKSRGRVYAELSHTLAKAGQLENLDLLPAGIRIDILLLRRDPFETYWSHLVHSDFFQSASVWLSALDLRYPNVIVPAEPYREHGVFGRALWYVREMEARAAYYEKLLTTDSRVRTHRVHVEELSSPYAAATLMESLGHECDPAEVEIPAPAPEIPGVPLGSAERERAEHLFREIPGDAAELGKRFHDGGLRLGAPVHLFLQPSGNFTHQPLPPPSSAAKKPMPLQPGRAKGPKARGITGGPGDVGLSG